MRLQRAIFTLVIGLGLTGVAWAQAPVAGSTTTSGTSATGQIGTTTSGTTRGTTTTTTTGTGTTSATTASDANAAPAQDADTHYERDLFGGTESRWEASGFVGSNYGAAAADSSVDFGGSVGYLWKSVAGIEALASFAPKFDVANNAIFAGQSPQVNSFMVNAIGALPLGSDGQWQPFISGGLGAITLRSDALNGGSGNAVRNVFNPDDTRGGGNIGAGLMAYAGPWGIRADVRYFRAFTSNNTPSVTADSTAGAVASSVLPGLDFWRANIGLALRW